MGSCEYQRCHVYVTLPDPPPPTHATFSDQVREGERPDPVPVDPPVQQQQEVLGPNAIRHLSGREPSGSTARLRLLHGGRRLCGGLHRTRWTNWGHKVTEEWKTSLNFFIFIFFRCLCQCPGTAWPRASSSTRLIMSSSTWKPSGRFWSPAECGSTWVSGPATLRADRIRSNSRLETRHGCLQISHQRSPS